MAGKRKPRGRPPAGITVDLDGVTVEWTLEFKPRWPNEQRLLGQLGAKAANMLRTRIRDQGRTADGGLLHELREHVGVGRGRTAGSESRRRWWYTDAADKRFNTAPKRMPQEARKNPPRRNGDIVYKFRTSGPSKGKYHLRRVWRSYAEAKEAIGAKPKRDLSLTGAMWRSLTVKIGGSQRRRRIRLMFAGNDKLFKPAVIKNGEFVRTGKRNDVKRRSLRNRDKARLAMYGRSKGDGGAKGKQLFELMRLSDAEVAELTRDYAAAVELFQ